MKILIAQILNLILKRRSSSSDPETAKVVGRTARSVFTNVRERFKVASTNCRKDERDLFEFTDEVCSHPLRKRMTKRMEEKRDRLKRRLTAHESLDSNVSNGKRKDVDNLGGNGRKRKKINEISENIGRLHRQADSYYLYLSTIFRSATINYIQTD